MGGKSIGPVCYHRGRHIRVNHEVLYLYMPRSHTWKFQFRRSKLETRND